MHWLFKAYTSALRRHPVIVQSVQSGIFLSTGDVISQVVVEAKNPKTMSYKRTIQYFCVGAIYVGPVLTIWYKILHKYVGTEGKFYGLKKMAIDQFGFAPFGIAGFVISTAVFQGNSLQETKRKLKEVYPAILKANYTIWPAVQLVNFTLMPLQYQVLYQQTIGLLWNTYICYKTKPDDD